MSQGQVTTTIYGHLREARYDEAIQILEWELQVFADLSLPPDQQDQLSGWSLCCKFKVAAELSHKPGSAVLAGICPVSGGRLCSCCGFVGFADVAYDP